MYLNTFDVQQKLTQCKSAVVQSLRHVWQVVSDSLRPHGLQYARLPCSSLSPGVCSNSCPLSWWCHPTTSSSVIPFSSCFQSFPASGPFPMSQLLVHQGGQTTGASTSASFLPMNVQCWIPLGLTSWISLQSKRLSRVFSSTTIQKHQFFGVQPYLWFNSHVHISKKKKQLSKHFRSDSWAQISLLCSV